MAQEVVKALMLEIDGNLEKLRRELRKGEGDLTGFATKAKTVGKDVGAGADAMSNKFGAAARAGASAMETIARTGKASGEAMKQLVAQGSQAALFFGPQGALVGAIGISVVAIIGLFSRTREEMAAMERESRQSLDRIADLDAKALGTRAKQLRGGGFAPWDVDRIWESQNDPAQRRELLRARGLNRLERDATGRGGMIDDAMQRGLFSTANVYREQKKEIEDVVAAMQLELRTVEQLERARAKSESAQKATTDATKDAAEAAKELAREGERVADATKRLVGETLRSSVDLVAARYDELIAKAQDLARQGVDPAGNAKSVSDLESAKQAAVSTARALEEAAAAMYAIDMAQAQGIAPAWLSIDRLGEAAADLKQQLSLLTPGSELYLRVQQELLKVEKERAQLATSNDPKSTDAKPPAEEARDMADYAREVQQAADGALQLAQNLGGASESLVSMLRSVVQIAGNLPALAKAIDAGGAMGIISAGLPILGALSSMFGKSPEDQQRAQELRENTEAIRELTEKAGLLGGPGVSGAANLTGRQGLARFISQYSGSFEATAGLSAGNFARARGVNLGDFRELAAAYGITLNDSIDSFRQLKRAIDEASGKLGEFGDDLDSQRRQADAEIALYGVTDPLERLRIRQRATGGRSSALDGVTAGLDLSTTEGREQARRNAQALFDLMRSGGDRLTEGQLGGLDGDELLQALLDLIDGLRDVDGAVSSATGGSVVGGVSGYSGLTAAAGARLEDYNRALVTYARDAQVTRLDMLARLDQLAQHLLGPIPLPPLSALGGGRSGGAVQVTIGSIVIYVQAQGGARDDVLSAIGDGIERVTTDALYRGILQARIVAGDLRVAS